ncbi:MAG: SDR family NAD(P)-dependent oxidoreductase [Aureispira sp.]
MKKTTITLVTGGSRGLGRNMAIQLAKQGHQVIVTYHQNKEAAQDTVETLQTFGQAAALQLDSTQPTTFPIFIQQLKQTLSTTFGTEQLNYLVNNAGFGINVPFEQTAAEQLDALYQVHFKGPFLLTQQLLPLLTDQGGIVNVSSGLARFSFPGYAAYAAMKGAVEVLSRYQAKELGARGIRVNTIAPGAIETDFGGGVVRDNKALNQQIASATALGRVGVPDDIGSVVAFLCSEASRWVNAQRLEVSGGMML